MFAQADFLLSLLGVGELHAAFLNESRTRGCWWCLVQEIRIHGPKTMGVAQRSLLLSRLANQYRIGKLICLNGTGFKSLRDIHVLVLYQGPTSVGPCSFY